MKVDYSLKMEHLDVLPHVVIQIKVLHNSQTVVYLYNKDVIIDTYLPCQWWVASAIF